MGKISKVVQTGVVADIVANEISQKNDIFVSFSTGFANIVLFYLNIFIDTS